MYLPLLLALASSTLVVAVSHETGYHRRHRLRHRETEIPTITSVVTSTDIPFVEVSEGETYSHTNSWAGIDVEHVEYEEEGWGDGAPTIPSCYWDGDNWIVGMKLGWHYSCYWNGDNWIPLAIGSESSGDGMQNVEVTLTPEPGWGQEDDPIYPWRWGTICDTLTDSDGITVGCHRAIVGTDYDGPGVVAITTEVALPGPGQTPAIPSSGAQIQPSGSDAESQRSIDIELLTEIVWRITAPPGQSTAVPGYPNAPPGEVESTAGDLTPESGPGLKSPAPTVTVDGTILTITPGLSTTVDSTLVIVSTNDPDHTTVVVSSSGTAVTAIITRTATGATKTYDVSETHISGDAQGSLTDTAASPSSSKSDRHRLLGLRARSILGIVAGFGALF
ncbi:hypothetical protein M011DRAFT_526092 [Sporormia fimetaria CBS 119925]|uniref:Lytic polysaccharide monooxygenase n=1 Tax=Sporormia fimetaria CBS 119925 TaxID=1340428 RepID=A0A6A6VBG6_9PLEO|nr:hypothetical protein M011DRAFT_526092 [Sporormia fimetaria CBS 119925]